MKCGNPRGFGPGTPLPRGGAAAAHAPLPARRMPARQPVRSAGGSLPAGRPGLSSAVMAGLFAISAVGVVLYLSLVGGALTAAYLTAVVLKGIRLI